MKAALNEQRLRRGASVNRVPWNDPGRRVGIREDDWGRFQALWGPLGREHLPLTTSCDRSIPSTSLRGNVACQVSVAFLPGSSPVQCILFKLNGTRVLQDRLFVETAIPIDRRAHPGLFDRSRQSDVMHRLFLTATLIPPENVSHGFPDARDRLLARGERPPPCHAHGRFLPRDGPCCNLEDGSREMLANRPHAVVDENAR